MGASITVSARKPEDLAWIEIYGYTPVLTGRLSDYQGFDFIFNTIPSMIFDAHTLAKNRPGSHPHRPCLPTRRGGSVDWYKKKRDREKSVSLFLFIDLS